MAQLVGRLVWELEHQNGSTAPNVGYSPVTPKNTTITTVESSPKMWYNFLDHIFDHNEHFSLNLISGCGPVGRALDLGSRDRGFKSRSPDQKASEI